MRKVSNTLNKKQKNISSEKNTQNETFSDLQTQILQNRRSLNQNVSEAKSIFQNFPTFMRSFEQIEKLLPEIMGEKGSVSDGKSENDEDLKNLLESLPEKNFTSKTDVNFSKEKLSLEIEKLFVELLKKKLGIFLLIEAFEKYNKLRGLLKRRRLSNTRRILWSCFTGKKTQLWTSMREARRNWRLCFAFAYSEKKVLRTRKSFKKYFLQFSKS